MNISWKAKRAMEIPPLMRKSSHGWNWSWVSPWRPRRIHILFLLCIYIFVCIYVYIYIYMSYIAIYFLYTDSSKHSHKSAEVQEFQEHARQWISNSCWSCSSWQVDAGSTCISIVSPVPPGFCRDQSALLPSRSTWF